MSDQLLVTLAIDLSLVPSQTVTTVTATLTDVSSPPRGWNISQAALYGFPGNSCRPGSFLPTGHTAVPVGGSASMSAPFVGFCQAEAGNPHLNSDFNIVARFQTSGGGSWPSSNELVLTVVPSSPPPIDLVQDPAADFRSNQNSDLAAIFCRGF